VKNNRLGAAALSAIPIPPENHADCVTPNVLCCRELGHPCNFFRFLAIRKIARQENGLKLGLRGRFSNPRPRHIDCSLRPDSSEGASEPASTSPYSTPSSMRLRRNPPIKNAASPHSTPQIFSGPGSREKTRKLYYFRHFLAFSDDSSGISLIMSNRNNRSPYWISLAAKYKKAGPGKALRHAPRETRLR
jgi:hypothetical protein